MDWMTVNTFACLFSTLALTSTHWSVRLVAFASVCVNGWLMVGEASRC